MNIDSHLKKLLNLNEVTQIGIVVKDLEKAMNNFSNIFGISFPKVFIPEYFKMTYKGNPGNFRFKVALAMMGELQIEFLEPLEGETIYNEFLEKKGEGIHHLGVDIKNMDERLEALQKIGIGVLQSGDRVGSRFAYLDTEKLFGVIIELLEREKKM